MENNKENKDWATELFLKMTHKKGFPESIVGLDAEIEAFLRIVGDQPGNEYAEYDPELGEITRRVPSESGRDTGEWLIGKAIDCCDFFPSAITLRRIYERGTGNRHYSPADGCKSVDLDISSTK